MVCNRSRRKSIRVLAHFAQRVRRKECRSDLFPRPTVPFVAAGVAVIFVVPFGFLFGVDFAVAVRRQFAAAVKSTGFLGFIGHMNLSIKKERSVTERPS